MSCEIAPLAPLTDPIAIQEENDPGAILWPENTRLQPATNALIQGIVSKGGSANPTSAYRSPQYQEHLREVVTKQQELSYNYNPACDDLRRTIEREMSYHSLRPGQAVAGPNSEHCMGTAVDISWYLPDPSGIDEIARLNGFVRDVPSESWHFHLL